MSDLPQLDLAQAYVVVGPNDQRGPYTLDLLLNEVIAQRLSEATPVWWPGLSDWTTMGGHPGVVAELQRRRGDAAGAAPGWADPAAAQGSPPEAQYGQTDSGYAQPETGYAQTESPYSQPDAGFGQPEAASAQPEAAYSQPDAGFGQPQAAYSQPDTGFGQPEAAPVQPEAAYSQPDTGFGQPEAAPVQPEAGFAEPQVEEIVDAEIIDEPVAAAPGLDPQHLETFAQLVARSGARAEQLAAADAVDAALVEAVSAAVTGSGCAEVEREDGERSHELRYECQGGDVVLVSLGRPSSGDAASVRDDHVPLTVVYRSSSASATPDDGTGQHGEVTVKSDEWTGQATASVSLLLDLAYYLTDAGTVDDAAVARDVSATVAVVKSRLG